MKNVTKILNSKNVAILVKVMFRNNQQLVRIWISQLVSIIWDEISYRTKNSKKSCSNFQQESPCDDSRSAFTYRAHKDVSENLSEASQVFMCVCLDAAKLFSTEAGVLNNLCAELM